ncbi:MAG: hypothetical protein IKQ91_02805 [Oscillospiraceae bacterium]|nr:hypothetical protein [Oscillospiraceae bacterium]
MKPEFAENIIVYTIFKKKAQWYCTDKLIWQMDFRKLYDAYREKGRQMKKTEGEIAKWIGTFSEFISSRFRIPVLDRDTAPQFFEAIVLDQTSAGELAYQWTRTETEEDRLALLPSLYVDFDKKVLYSQYPEQDMSYDDLVPDGWKGAYYNFLSMIPQAEQYWKEAQC